MRILPPVHINSDVCYNTKIVINPSKQTGLFYCVPLSQVSSRKLTLLPIFRPILLDNKKTPIHAPIYKLNYREG